MYNNHEHLVNSNIETYNTINQYTIEKKLQYEQYIKQLYKHYKQIYVINQLLFTSQITNEFSTIVESKLLVPQSDIILHNILTTQTKRISALIKHYTLNDNFDIQERHKQVIRKLIRDKLYDIYTHPTHNHVYPFTFYDTENRFNTDELRRNTSPELLKLLARETTDYLNKNFMSIIDDIYHKIKRYASEHNIDSKQYTIPTSQLPLIYAKAHIVASLRKQNNNTLKQYIIVN